ncbi:MAG: hypothetical protein LBR07_04425 [Puniceicoccales bacterium]|jgi:hypothetical protein|nr:hypothetical protein [Puniceicoccales bacterium]
MSTHITLDQLPPKYRDQARAQIAADDATADHTDHLARAAAFRALLRAYGQKPRATTTAPTHSGAVAAGIPPAPPNDAGGTIEATTQSCATCQARLSSARLTARRGPSTTADATGEASPKRSGGSEARRAQLAAICATATTAHVTATIRRTTTGDTALIMRPRRSRATARTAADRMTHTERLFIRWFALAIEPGDYERVTLRLDGGSRYTPDFFLADTDGTMLCIEVKGAYRLPTHGRALTAFREARAQFPMFRFRWFCYEPKTKTFRELYAAE